MPRDDFEELLGAYALDACDPDEAAAVAAHLNDCPRCRAELAAHLEVAGVLGNLGGEAPDGLWDRIWGEIGSPAERDDDSSRDGHGRLAPVRDRWRTRRRPFGVDRGHRRRPAEPKRRLQMRPLHRPVAPPPTERAGRRWTLCPRRRRRRCRTCGRGRHPRDDRREPQPSGERPQQGRCHGRRARGRASRPRRPGPPGGPARELVGPWKAQLVVSCRAARPSSCRRRCRPIPSSRTFQAWAVVHGKFVSLGVLGRSGQIHQLLLQPGMTAILVNTEPLGGTSQPTTAPLLKGNLPATTQ